MVVHVSNPSYLGDGERNIVVQGRPPGKKPDPTWKNELKKKRLEVQLKWRSWDKHLWVEKKK
jgi:hypothetical protein